MVSNNEIGGIQTLSELGKGKLETWQMFFIAKKFFMKKREDSKTFL